MTRNFDVIVIGLGGFGSAAAYELAKRGVSVLGLEQFDLAHALGSSHGETRIIRRAYFEHPDYVPLLEHTYRMWRELESESGRELMNLCGLVLAGPEDGEAVPGVQLAKKLHDVSIEALDWQDATDRFPQFLFNQQHTILEEQDAGYLRVDDCVQTHLDRATEVGATLLGNQRVINWSSGGDCVTVETEAETFEAARLVLAGGAWSPSLLSELDMQLSVVRKPVFWFSQTPAAEADWPVFYFEDNNRSFYGLPGLSGADVKVAEHSGGDSVTDPTTVDREMLAAEHDAVCSFAKSTLAGLEAIASRHSVCMYTMSRDGHFVVDEHPSHSNVAIAAGFSGHGFKFTPVIGKALADLSLEGETDLPIGFLSVAK